MRDTSSRSMGTASGGRTACARERSSTRPRALRRTPGALALLLAVGLLAPTMMVGGADASVRQQPPSSSSTVPDPPSGNPPTPASDPAGSVPADASGTPAEGSAPVSGEELLVPPLADDALLGAQEQRSSGGYADQPAFDMASRARLGGEVAKARRDLATATAAAVAAQERLDELNRTQSELSSSLESVRRGRSDQVARAARSREQLRSRVVESYIRGDQSLALYSVIDDPVTFSRGFRYLEAISNLDLAALEEYRAAISELDGQALGMVERQSALQRQVSDQAATVLAAETALADADLRFRAYQAGSHVFAAGFRFPVVGPVNFIDSWGFPRLFGSDQAHWHEGTDIMAPPGRELVAVENGSVFKIGEAGLGGLRVWLRGDSGAEYYYAHLSGFVSPLVENQRVAAGEVIGFVGDTGSAKGGAAHLHFEIHPGGGAPVNPFPLLRAAWGDQPMPSESEALAGPGAMLGRPTSAVMGSTTSRDPDRR